MELEAAILPARLEQLPGRYPDLPQDEAAVGPMRPEVEPGLPAGPDHRDGWREQGRAAAPCPRRRLLLVVAAVAVLPLARQGPAAAWRRRRHC